jgi:alpha-tubulin suppressor-like RCC1 family protein
VQPNRDSYCWGRGNRGQLATGSLVAELLVPTLTTVPDSLMVTVGQMHTCFLLVDKTVRCAGRNIEGQLNTGGTTDSGTAIDAGFTNVKWVSAGSLHTCLVTSANGIRCIGGTVSTPGVRGDGSSSASITYTTATSISDAVQVASGTAFTCYLGTTGAVKCTGEGGEGQLGYSSTTDRTTFTATAVASGSSFVSAGDAHACALMATGGVRCWGRGTEGQLGSGLTTAVVSTPVTPVGFDSSGASGVSAGYDYTCLRRVNATLSCFGTNGASQLGDGTTTQRNSPVMVLATENGLVDQIAAGVIHTCLIRAGGVVRCLGDGVYGKLGRNSNVASTVAVTSTGMGLTLGPTRSPTV